MLIIVAIIGALIIGAIGFLAYCDMTSGKMEKSQKENRKK